MVEAELLLHVVDASVRRDAAEHTAHVMETLGQIGADATPQILVLNKMDLIPGGGRREGAGAAHPRKIRSISRRPRWRFRRAAAKGVEALLKKIDETLALDPVWPCRFRFPLGKARRCTCCMSTAACLDALPQGLSARWKRRRPNPLRAPPGEILLRSRAGYHKNYRPGMNLPNLLTLLRIFFVPLLVAALLADGS